MSSRFFQASKIVPSLVNTTHKLARATDHLDSINREVRAFIETKPYQIIRENDLDAREQLVKINFQSAPPHLGLIVGDFAQCLRSALDYLAWQLALLTTPAPDKRTQFPIFLSPNPKDFQRFVTSILPVAIPVIESLQPYSPYRGLREYGNHPLWHLHELSNIDKHRVIPIHCTALNVSGPQGSSRKFVILNGHGVPDNYCEIRVPLPAQGQDESEPEPMIEITLGQSGGIEIPVRRLQEIYRFVSEEVVPKFAGFFP